MYIRSNDSKHGKAGSPYYVGKGRGKRAYDKKHRCKPPSDPSKIVFVVTGLSEQEALQEEVRIIALYGRIDNGTGCLANLTDGGEGQSGRLVTEEERRRKSEWMKAHPNRGNVMVACRTPEAREKAASGIRGKKRTDDWRMAQSERMRGKSHPAWNKGIPRTEEQKKRHSQLLTGRKQSAESVAKRAAANKESSLNMFGCTGIERRRMRRRERYAERKQMGLVIDYH